MSEKQTEHEFNTSKFHQTRTAFQALKIAQLAISDLRVGRLDYELGCKIIRLEKMVDHLVIDLKNSL